MHSCLSVLLSLSHITYICSLYCSDWANKWWWWNDGLMRAERPPCLSSLMLINHFYRVMHYCTVQSVVLRLHVVCPSVSVCPTVTLMDHDHIGLGWKSWKLIARTISPTSSLFIAQRSSTYFQGNMEKFGGESVRSTPTSITSGWIESTESHVILGGGVAVCLFTFVGALRGHLCDSTAFLLLLECGHMHVTFTTQTHRQLPVQSQTQLITHPTPHLPPAAGVR